MILPRWPRAAAYVLTIALRSNSTSVEPLAAAQLGGVTRIRDAFIGFQRHLLLPACPPEPTAETHYCRCS